MAETGAIWRVAAASLTPQTTYNYRVAIENCAFETKEEEVEEDEERKKEPALCHVCSSSSDLRKKIKGPRARVL